MDVVNSNFVNLNGSFLVLVLYPLWCRLFWFFRLITIFISQFLFRSPCPLAWMLHCLFYVFSFPVVLYHETSFSSTPSLYLFLLSRLSLARRSSLNSLRSPPTARPRLRAAILALSERAKCKSPSRTSRSLSRSVSPSSLFASSAFPFSFLALAVIFYL